MKLRLGNIFCSFVSIVALCGLSPQPSKSRMALNSSSAEESHERNFSRKAQIVPSRVSDGMRASFKFTLRNAKLFFRRDFAQMQTDSPVFAENNIIWQPCRELICLAAHLLHKVAKCRPIVIDLREFNARFLPKRFMPGTFPSFAWQALNNSIISSRLRRVIGSLNQDTPLFATDRIQTGPGIDPQKDLGTTCNPRFWQVHFVYQLHPRGKGFRQTARHD